MHAVSWVQLSTMAVNGQLQNVLCIIASAVTNNDLCKHYCNKYPGNNFYFSQQNFAAMSGVSWACTILTTQPITTPWAKMWRVYSYNFDKCKTCKWTCKLHLLTFHLTADAGSTCTVYDRITDVLWHTIPLRQNEEQCRMLQPSASWRSRQRQSR